MPRLLLLLLQVCPAAVRLTVALLQVVLLLMLQEVFIFFGFFCGKWQLQKLQLHTVTGRQRYYTHRTLTAFVRTGSSSHGTGHNSVEITHQNTT